MPLRTYRYTHKRLGDHDRIITYNCGNITGHTAKEIKHRLVKRFGLQAWESWTCTVHGTYQKTHPWTPERPYRGLITVEPIKDAKT